MNKPDHHTIQMVESGTMVNVDQGMMNVKINPREIDNIQKCFNLLRSESRGREADYSKRGERNRSRDRDGKDEHKESRRSKDHKEKRRSRSKDRRRRSRSKERRRRSRSKERRRSKDRSKERKYVIDSLRLLLAILTNNISICLLQTQSIEGTKTKPVTIT